MLWRICPIAGHSKGFAILLSACLSLHAVATRAGLSESVLGKEEPLATLPVELLGSASKASGLVSFSEDELAELNITKESLTD